MDFRSEFLSIVNSAIEQKSCADGKHHSGEGLVILVPVPVEASVDCNDTGEINLDNAEVSVSSSQKFFDPQSGELVFDAKEHGQILYRVTGIVR